MRMTLRIVGRVFRSRLLARVVGAYALFILTEYAVWIGVLVYAYGQGGAAASGLAALAQLAPSVLIAPLIATVADRHGPGRLMTASYVVQAVSTAALGGAVLLSAPPAVAYAAAVVAATAVSTIRPAQSALVPALTRDVPELTAVNVVIGWLESVGIVLAGLATGLALALGSVASIFLGAAILLLIAGALVAPLHVPASSVEDGSPGAFEQVGQGISQMLGSRAARVLVGLLGAEYVLIGALDVLFVVVAVEMLHLGQAWTGYLNTAYGAGGVILGSLAALSVGRRLGPIILVSAAAVGVALAAIAIVPGPESVVVLLAVVGGARATFDVSTRALLQRTVPAQLVARVFGLAEGLSMAGLAVGSLLTPVLVAIGGGRSALIGVAAVLPLIVGLQARVVLRLDQAADVPVVETALLRGIPLFRDLPSTALEGVARALERRDVTAGEVLIREGDVGEHYYAIATGSVEVVRRGERVRLLGRGEGAGEIALLRGVRRTASVVAVTAVTVYVLDRESFLTAVNGHVPTLTTAQGIADDVQGRDERRRGSVG